MLSYRKNTKKSAKGQSERKKVLFSPKTAADFHAPSPGVGGTLGPSFCTPAALHTESTHIQTHRYHQPASSTGAAFISDTVAECGSPVSAEDLFKQKKVEKGHTTLA